MPKEQVIINKEEFKDTLKTFRVKVSQFKESL